VLTERVRPHVALFSSSVEQKTEVLYVLLYRTCPIHCVAFRDFVMLPSSGDCWHHAERVIINLQFKTIHDHWNWIEHYLTVRLVG